MVLTYELSIIELMDAARDGDIAAIQEWSRARLDGRGTRRDQLRDPDEIKTSK